MKKFASFFAVFLFITLFAVASEAGDRNIPVEVAQLTDSLKKQFAPDRRVALLDVDYSFSDKNVMLRGVTTSAEAKNVLLKELARKGYAVMDCLELLPDVKGLEGKTCGIINVSVANMRVAPDFSSEMMTQSLMGMPVRVLQRDGWVRIQTPDNYIAWVHRVGVHPVTEEEMAAWNKAEKIVEVGREQGSFLQGDLSRRSPGIHLQIHSHAREEMAFRLAAGCRRHYPYGTHHDGNTLSLGGNFIERRGLQRIHAYHTFYARHHYTT